MPLFDHGANHNKSVAINDGIADDRSKGPVYELAVFLRLATIELMAKNMHRLAAALFAGALMAATLSSAATAFVVEDSTAPPSGDQLGPDHPCLRVLKKAYEAFDAGRYDVALENYGKAAAVADSDVCRFQALFGLGATYSAKGRFADAVEPLEEAALLRPDHSETLYMLAGSYAAVDRINEAVTVLEKAIQVAPDFVPARRDLGLLYGRLGWHQQAGEQYREALRRDPEDLDAQLGWAVALYHSGQYREAVAAFDRALELDANDPRTYYGRGSANLMAGNRQAAIEDYAALKAIDPELARDLYERIFP
jgi:tetratricopeptide (TPR) repeat protein